MNCIFLLLLLGCCGGWGNEGCCGNGCGCGDRREDCCRRRPEPCGCERRPEPCDCDRERPCHGPEPCGCGQEGSSGLIPPPWQDYPKFPHRDNGENCEA